MKKLKELIEEYKQDLRKLRPNGSTFRTVSRIIEDLEYQIQ